MSEGTYTVWYKLPGEEEFVPELNYLGMVHNHSLNAAIKCERFYQRMHGAVTKRIYNDKI